MLRRDWSRHENNGLSQSQDHLRLLQLLQPPDCAPDAGGGGGGVVPGSSGHHHAAVLVVTEPDSHSLKYKEITLYTYPMLVQCNGIEIDNIVQ